MSKKEETKYNKIVGRIGNDYYFLDYTFLHSDNFRGATGSKLSPLTEDEYNKRVEDYFNIDNMREYWQQAVEAKKTDLGLDDWIELVRDTDGEEYIIDRSDEPYAEILREMLGHEAFEVECVGGGRCFKKNMKFDEVYNKKLVKEINKFEE